MHCVGAMLSLQTSKKVAHVGIYVF